MSLIPAANSDVVLAVAGPLPATCSMASLVRLGKTVPPCGTVPGGRRGRPAGIAWRYARAEPPVEAAGLEMLGDGAAFRDGAAIRADAKAGHHVSR